MSLDRHPVKMTQAHKHDFLRRWMHHTNAPLRSKLRISACTTWHNSYRIKYSRCYLIRKRVIYQRTRTDFPVKYFQVLIVWL